MSKNAYFIGQPIFSQLLNLIPRTIIDQTATAYQSDRYVKKFKTYDHLIAMLYCCLMRCESIRELTTGLQASMNRLKHLGLSYSPRRSTISDANSRRNEEVFGVIFHKLVKLYFPFLPDSCKQKRIEDKLFIVDSTTISLFSDIMKGAGAYDQHGRKKGGAKAHVMLKANEDVPVFVMLSEAKQNDQVFMRYLPLTAGSFVVFDKAYSNSQILSIWDEHQISWVSRRRAKTNIQCITHLKIDQQASPAILNDQLIRMGRRSNKSTKEMLVRLVTYYDQETKKVFEFITNNFEISAQSVADLYKRRWQIELMFKRWKSSNPLRYFLGNSENAIKIQLWASLITDLLIQVIRKQLKKYKVKWSFANLSGLIRQHLFTYIKLMEFLKNPEKTLLQNMSKNTRSNQLDLFDSS